MRSTSGNTTVEYIVIFTVVIVVVLTIAFSQEYSPFQHQLKKVYYKGADEINLATQRLAGDCGEIVNGTATPCISGLSISGDPFPEEAPTPAEPPIILNP